MNTRTTLSLIFVLTFSLSQAQNTYETTGIGSGDWNLAVTWTCSGPSCDPVPPKDFSDSVFVHHDVFRDDNQDMKVEPTGHLDVLGAMLTTDGGLIVEGSMRAQSSVIHLEGDKNFDFSGTAQIDVSNVCLTSEMGNFKNDGTMDGSAAIYLPGDGNIDASGTSTGSYEYCINMGNVGAWSGPGTLTEDCDLLTGVPNYCDLSIILPVELMSFILYESRHSVVLEWSTAVETNSSHFVVEVSENGKDFLPVGTVDGAGMAHTHRDYRFEDKSSMDAQRIYYRLRAVDLDGRFTLSQVLEHKRRSREEMVYPTLARVGDRIILQGFTGAVHLISTGGRFDLVSVNDEGSTIVETAQLMPGVYILRARDGSPHRFVLTQ